MKIIGIDGSPRKDGNTEKLLKKVLAGTEEAGSETQFLKLADLTINYCHKNAPIFLVLGFSLPRKVIIQSYANEKSTYLID
jgi:hypothetical protein